MLVFVTAMLLACDQAHEAEAVTPRDIEPPAEFEGCQVGANPIVLAAHWSESQVDKSSPSGVFHVALENASSSTILVHLELIVRLDDQVTIALPDQEIAAKSTLPVALDLTAAGVPKVARKTPGQLLLRIVANPGTEQEQLFWSEPVYTHFDTETDAYMIYDAAVLKSKYSNGDLTGTLAKAGGAPGAEFVAGNGV